MCVRKLAKVGLLLAVAASCRPADNQQDIVLVFLKLPVGLTYDGFRLAKFVGDAAQPATIKDTLATEGGAGFVHSVGVGRPAGTSVTLSAQAYQDNMVLAEGRVRIDEEGSAPGPLALVACPMEVPLMKGVFRSCLTSAPDAGVDRSGASAMSLDASDAWTAPDCQSPKDPKAVTEPLPATASPDCLEYCDDMTKNCPEVEVGASLGRCYRACTLLNWPVGRNFEADTITCRKSYARAAGGAQGIEKAARCAYASPDSQKACGDPCPVYCRMGALICPDFFPEQTICRMACAAHEEFIQQVDSGSADIRVALTCRMEWLTKAIFNHDLCSWSAPFNNCSASPLSGCASLFRTP